MRPLRSRCQCSPFPVAVHITHDRRRGYQPNDNREGCQSGKCRAGSRDVDRPNYTPTKHARLTDEIGARRVHLEQRELRPRRHLIGVGKVIVAPGEGSGKFGSGVSWTLRKSVPATEKPDGSGTWKVCEKTSRETVVAPTRPSGKVNAARGPNTVSWTVPPAAPIEPSGVRDGRMTSRSVCKPSFWISLGDCKLKKFPAASRRRR